MSAQILVGNLICLAALAGCSSGPTLADAREMLQEGDPERALSAARGAAGAQSKRPERIALHRVAFHASLSAGWSHEAAREYLSLRNLTGREDPTLLVRLGRSTFELALRSVDASRRVSAVRDLRLLLDDAETPNRLAAALNDPQPVVRATAARTAGQLRDLTQALAHLTAASGDRDPLVRRAALQTLGGMLEHADDADLHRPVEDLAIAALSDPSPDVRLAGIDLIDALLARRGHHDALVPALRRAVRNGSDSVCLRAAVGLLEVSPAEALSAWQAAGHSSPELAPFGRALAAHSDGISSAAQLRRDLRHLEYRHRLSATRGLAGPAAQSYRRELLGLLRADPVSSVRRAALRALLCGDESTRAAAIAAGLEQDDASVRRLAFNLHEAQQPWSIDELEAWLRSRDPALAPEVTRLLAERGGERGLSLLLEGMSHPSTRLPAASALTAAGGDAMRESFLELLANHDPQLRHHAAAGLTACARGEDRALLVEALERQEQHADLGAAAALLSLEARLAAAPAAAARRLPD